MTKRRENDLGEPSGIVLSATTSFWLPVSHKFVFDFLRDESTRTQVLKEILILYINWIEISCGICSLVDAFNVFEHSFLTLKNTLNFEHT